MKPAEADVTYPLSRVRERVGVRADAKEKARELRGQMTEAESLLWLQLKTHGLVVIRFWNHEVMNETPAVLEKIWQTLQALTPTLSRKRERE